MRKIWPSEDNCIKLRDNFARWKSRCEFLSPLCENFAHLKSKCEIGTPACENWIFLPTLFLLIFLCLNFHFLLVFNYSCNSLARKYPRKGKITFLYKFSCNHWKIIFRGVFSRRPTDVNSTLSEIQRSLLLSFSLYYFLFSWKPNTLWGCFPRGWEAKPIVSWSKGS